MPSVAWTTPTARSSNVLSTVADSLANGAESATITINNSTEKKPYLLLTLKLGSLTPSTAGSVAIRITLNDGTDTADKIGGTVYPVALTSGASAKVAVISCTVPPLSLRVSIINNSGVSFPASGNELYYRFYTEEAV